MQHFLLPLKFKDNPWQRLFAGEWGQNLELHPCKRTQPAAGGGHDLILDGSRLGAVPCFSQHGAAVTHQGKPTQVAWKSRCVQTTAHTSGRRDQQHVPGFRKSWGLTKGWENPLPGESHTGLRLCLSFFCNLLAMYQNICKEAEASRWRLRARDLHPSLPLKYPKP